MRYGKVKKLGNNDLFDMVRKGTCQRAKAMAAAVLRERGLQA